LVAVLTYLPFGTPLALAQGTAEKEIVMTRKALPIVATLTVLIAMVARQAEAQPRRKVTLEASVPFEFVVGNRAYPAGRYTFEMATGAPKSTDRSGVLIVRNRERRLYTAVATTVTADRNPHDGHKLIFVRNGDRVFLSKVWRQGNPAGLSVPTAPGVIEAIEAADEGQKPEVLTLEAALINGRE
jgi:hypothetical protein